jgi:hypothetical protein
MGVSESKQTLTSDVVTRSEIYRLSLDCQHHLLEYLRDDVYAIGRLMLTNPLMEKSLRIAIKNIRLKLIVETDNLADHEIINFIGAEHLYNIASQEAILINSIFSAILTMDQVGKFTSLQKFAAPKSVDIRVLCQLPNLRSLKIHRLYDGDSDADNIFVFDFAVPLPFEKRHQIMPKLKSLDVHYPIGRYFSDLCPNLESFKIRSTQAGTVFATDVHINNLPRLRKVKVNDPISTIDAQSLANIECLKINDPEHEFLGHIHKLKKLIVTNPSTEFLDKLCKTHSCSLTYLGISLTDSPHDLRYYSDYFAKFPNLVHLKFKCEERPNFQQGTPFSFASISNLPLKSIYLSSARIFDDCDQITKLQSVKKCTFGLIYDPNVHTYMSQLNLSTVEFKLFYNSRDFVLKYAHIPEITITCISNANEMVPLLEAIETTHLAILEGAPVSNLQSHLKSLTIHGWIPPKDYGPIVSRFRTYVEKGLLDKFYFMDDVINRETKYVKKYDAAVTKLFAAILKPGFVIIAGMVLFSIAKHVNRFLGSGK